jgi:hypothetical protein
MKKKSLLSIVLAFILIILAHGIWDVSLSKDEMTGEKSAYASSSATFPTEIMDFPYSDTKAWLGVGSDGNSEWVYVGFNNSPNLNNTDTQDGYNLIRTRIKWDDEVENVTITQDWGSKFLHFRNDKLIIKKIAKSNSVLLELDWHGEGKVYFKFSLKGSSSALKKMRNQS